MIRLSEEQRRKIEENKAAALLKKQQAVQKLKTTAETTNLTSCSKNEDQNDDEDVFEVNVFDSFRCVRSPTPIPAACKIFGENRFLLDMPYYAPSIEIFKTVTGRKYELQLKKWSFPLSEQSTLVSKLKSLDHPVDFNKIPECVIRVLLQEGPSETEQVDWSKIDKVLRDHLLPFQVEGIRFGIHKGGRCLIADDMGLGKTIQALGIAHYFKDNWPLLIVCPSSMRFPWQEAIHTFLPSVQPSVTVLTSGKDSIMEGDIVISSYDLMKNCCEDLIKRKFGVIIFDESHLLKSLKTARTKAAIKIGTSAKNVILLSGTPALSRPEELFSQIYIIDPHTFLTFHDFGMRYCDGQMDRYGWNYSGASNLKELELYLRKKLMIRRLKSEVIRQLPSKMRKVIILNPNMVKTVTKQMKKLETEYTNQKGAEKHSTLLSYYSVTGDAKLKAVCEYIKDKLENENKFLIFAHHSNVIKGICDLLDKKRVNYIKIDGSVNSEVRKISCDKFQNDSSCRVAVLSIKAANCGITLTAAQLVIFAELYWNPGEITQAEDRAHRIGQQDTVLIEYLIAKNTADHHLWRLIENKLKTLNQVGLSMECFKDAELQELTDHNQPTITSMLQKNTENSEKKTPNDVNVSDDFLTAEADDDIFVNINLEEIENEYYVNNKKRKTGVEC